MKLSNQTRSKISASIKKVHATGRKMDGSKAAYSKASPVLSSLDGIGKKVTAPQTYVNVPLTSTPVTAKAGMFGKAAKKVRTKVSGAGKAIKRKAAKVKNTAKRAAKSVKTATAQAMRNVNQSVRKAAASVKKAAKAAGRAVKVRTVKTGQAIKRAGKYVKRKALGAGRSIKSGFKKTGAAVASPFKKAYRGIRSFKLPTFRKRAA